MANRAFDWLNQAVKDLEISKKRSGVALSGEG